MRNGIPVTVFEAGADLSTESRASTFHPPTLDMLDALGAVKPLIAQGLVAPTFQYRTMQHGILARFDFSAIADLTAHPYRLQCEQSRLTRILYEQLREQPEFTIEFGCEVTGVSQGSAGVTATIQRNGKAETRTGRWLIGADGARSEVRRSLGIDFDGLHLAGAIPGGQHALRFLQRHRGARAGQLCRRPAALAIFCCRSRGCGG